MGAFTKAIKQYWRSKALAALLKKKAQKLGVHLGENKGEVKS